MEKGQEGWRKKEEQGKGGQIFISASYWVCSPLLAAWLLRQEEEEEVKRKYISNRKYE